MKQLDSIAERDVQAEEIEAHLRDQNEKLVNALYEAREQITSLKEEVGKLCAPPSTYGVYLSVNEDGTINVLAQGRKVKVNLHPSLKAEALKPGQELVLNEGLNVVEEHQGPGAPVSSERRREQLQPEREKVTHTLSTDTHIMKNARPEAVLQARNEKMTLRPAAASIGSSTHAIDAGPTRLPGEKPHLARRNDALTRHARIPKVITSAPVSI